MKRFLGLCGFIGAIFLLATPSPFSGQGRGPTRGRAFGQGPDRVSAEGQRSGQRPSRARTPRPKFGQRSDRDQVRDVSEGQRLFERETFGGNGRTCRTCHGPRTGTVSPQDAERRLQENPADPLFLHDGSDDGNGNGTSRMLADATILVPGTLPANVRLADTPNVRTVALRRGIPTTLNTPALDPVLMLDGREPSLESQAASAIAGHALGTIPDAQTLALISEFERTSPRFFSSRELQSFAQGGPAPRLPRGRSDSERRGRRFFDNVSPDEATGKRGLCASCHSGPMLNETNESFFAGPNLRFQNVRVSEFNEAENPVMSFIFTNPGEGETLIESPDPGRALITGNVDDANAFKIPTLHGIRRTAPYFHDNSAKTLEDLLAHYAEFFELVADTTLTVQDQEDIVAFLKLL